MHPWIGAGDEDRRHILKELGLDHIDDLFSTIHLPHPYSGYLYVTKSVGADAKLPDRHSV